MKHFFKRSEINLKLLLNNIIIYFPQDEAVKLPHIQMI